jgi:hypothetical protein
VLEPQESTQSSPHLGVASEAQIAGPRFGSRYPRQNATGCPKVGYQGNTGPNYQGRAEMAIYSIGDLGRREILKMSAVLAGSGVVFSCVRQVQQIGMVSERG